MNFGFLIGRGELIPEIFSCLDKKDIFLYFLTQFNAYVQKELTVPLQYVLNLNSLEEIFEAKIQILLNNLDINHIKKICPLSAEIIHNYKNKSFKDKIILDIPYFSVAKLIKMIYFKETPGLVFNSKDFFINYVFSKIQKMHKDKEVIVEENVLYLTKNDGKVLCVMPSFSEFNREKEGTFDRDLRKAFNMCKENMDIYLVLPRQKKLCRHIEIKGCNSSGKEKSIKVVPYSINNKIIKKG
ncbi:hypothetical protein [Campylobacter blaseri]|nr:hypothetical protein [Campylobacter blaseri]